MNLIEGLLNGNKRACAKIITLVENNEKDSQEILRSIYKHTGKAYVIGITGPPGGGKSTLTYSLTRELRNQGKKIGVIAIDPTSPFTGGSILGDRIRMNKLATDPNVFIRSMGTRGHLGGLSKATNGTIKVLDAFGCDYIIVETVGVGQSEVDIVKAADTVIMVMVPGLGDDIQAIKAGIMEIADIFAINKSDLEGADKTAREIGAMLEMGNEARKSPILNVIASQDVGITELISAIEDHKEYLLSSNQFKSRRVERIGIEIICLIQDEIKTRIFDDKEVKQFLDNMLKDIYDKKIDPYTVKEKLFKIIT